MIIKAIDDGYGDLKYSSTTNTGLIPSFVTSYKPKPTQEINHKHIEDPYISLIDNNNKYLVGDYASRLDPNIRWIGGENKHRDSRFPILLKSGLGLMTGNKSFEKIDTLVMGLPNKYDTPDRVDTLSNLAKGVHRFDISADGHNYTGKQIEVEDVIVKKQPFGSLCYLILDEEGELKDPKLASGFNVIVDIGARTLNILTIDGMMEQPALTTHSNDGIFVAFQNVEKYIESELGLSIPDGKLPRIMKEEKVGNLDLSELINESYRSHANNILSIIDTLLVNSYSMVTSIIFTGGGSELLKPYLENHYHNFDIKFLDRFATVKGLRYYGVRQTNKRKNVNVRIG